MANPTFNRERAKALRAGGASVLEIARYFGVSWDAAKCAVDDRYRERKNARRRERLKCATPRRTAPQTREMDAYKVPAARAARLVRGLADKVGGPRAFAILVDLNERRIHSILGREYPNVSFEVMDQILVRCGLVYLWHVPPPEGFADIYLQDLEEAA